MPSERHHPAPSPDDPEPKAISGPDEIEDILQDVLIPCIRFALPTTLNGLSCHGYSRSPETVWQTAEGNGRAVLRMRCLVDEVPVTFADDRTNSEQERQFDSEDLRTAMRDLPHRQRDAVEMLKLREMVAEGSGGRKRNERRVAQSCGPSRYRGAS